MPDDRDHLPDRLDDATLARYLSGTCGADELAQVERWLEADPAHRAELARLRAAWNPAPVPEADRDDQMWQWLAARMDAPLPGPTLVREAGADGSRQPSRARRIGRADRRSPAYTWRAGLIAAAVALVVGGALLFRLAPHLGERAGAGAGGAGVPSAMRELATSRGERATGNLPDGSRVILGPDSRLRIPATFAATPSAGGARDVHLEGEAFFEVTHDSTRPFRVHTANGVAEDLGTEFVVTAYPETRATRVVVASGVVELRGRDTPLTLEAGDLGRIDAAGAATLTRNVDVSTYVGWTKGDLVFDEVPLRDALAQLARWYDVDIRLADTTLGDRRFTATFHDEPVSRVLRVLEIALDARAEQTGRLVTLRPMQ